MDPTIWGPSAWKFMHCVTLGYTKYPTNKNKHDMKTFFENLCDILPCNKCKRHFQDHFDKFPLNDSILSSKKKLFQWLVDVRNSVNTQQNKPHISYDSVLCECLNKNKKTIYLLVCVIIMLLILILAIGYRYIKNK